MKFFYSLLCIKLHWQKLQFQFFSQTLFLFYLFLTGAEVLGQGGNGLWQAVGNDTVTTNRQVAVTKNMQVQGLLSADSIKTKNGNFTVTDSITIKTYVLMKDSVRVLGTLKIGSNSLSLAGSAPGGTDEINSTNGVISFGNTGSPYSNINVGIGTKTPAFKLHLENDGGILSTGNIFGIGQTLPDGLTGPRLIWYPKKAAFRAGMTDVPNFDAWDDINIGEYSIAGGNSIVASGISSTAFGFGNNAIGNFSVAIGAQNDATGLGSTAIGNTNDAKGECAIALGKRNHSYGLSSISIGHNTFANFDHSVAIGNDVIANALNSFIFGYGVPSLSNSTSNSLIVGFNSDFPTLFVSGGDGTLGSFGNVGIGTTVPSEKLDVEGNARIRQLATGPTGEVDVVVADANGVLFRGTGVFGATGPTGAQGVTGNDGAAGSTGARKATQVLQELLVGRVQQDLPVLREPMAQQALLAQQVLPVLQGQQVHQVVLMHGGLQVIQVQLLQ